MARAAFRGLGFVTSSLVLTSLVPAVVARRGNLDDKELLGVQASRSQASDVVDSKSSLQAENATAVASSSYMQFGEHLQHAQGTLHYVHETLATRLEYELHGVMSDSHAKNKVILAVIEGLGVGMFGIDRCYLGQGLLGTVKCVTCGGLTIWGIVDYLVIMYNLLAKEKKLDTLGMKAKFKKDDVDIAFWVAIILFVFTTCGGGVGSQRRGRSD
eukprot:TRINITY_DN90563_c0_g1_i1.p1 TRINITY_DN90563_c0_g1~~TRINITY_DN90563_c0_g1_i1.p1  ORF type:complete len:214 (-),score=36.69 TRINITY_DN90563_c0_g1_i1:108-749(-)